MMQRPTNVFRRKRRPSPPGHHPTDTPARRSPLKEVADLQGLRFKPLIRHMEQSGKSKDNFELMNVKVVVYNLTGLVCDVIPVKRQESSDGKEIPPLRNGIIGKGNSPFITNAAKSATREIPEKDLGVTNAVVSCQKNGIRNELVFETYLPSRPLGNPMDGQYAASWPSEHLQQEDAAIEKSAFEITRCMKKTVFVSGMPVRSNFCYETLEIGINISRGTELIRLGTTLLVFNGEEEEEVLVNLPTIPVVLNNNRSKKKTHKYGYFSNDSSRRYHLGDNSILKVGVQVIPEEAVRLAREQRKISRNLSDENNLVQEGIQTKCISIEAATMSGSTEKKRSSHSLFPENFLCGAVPVQITVPSSWIPNFFKRSQSEPEIPKEIITNNNADLMIISTLTSSVSESRDELDIIGE